MISIYLCEDNPKQLEYFTKIIRNFLLMQDLDAELTCSVTTPKELLDKLEEDSPDFGLYFLDICLGKNMNGLQLGKKIREKDPFGDIVFITSKSELCLLIFQYEVRALDFIVKDDIELLSEKIVKCIRAANRKYQKMHTDVSESFFIKQGGEQVEIPVDEVLYIETLKEAPHKVMICTKSKVYHTYGTIKEFEVLLKPYHTFCRCHQSILVNEKYIQDMDKRKGQILLTNGSTCRASVRFLRNGKKGSKIRIEEA